MNWATFVRTIVHILLFFSPFLTVSICSERKVLELQEQLHFGMFVSFKVSFSSNEFSKTLLLCPFPKHSHHLRLVLCCQRAYSELDNSLEELQYSRFQGLQWIRVLRMSLVATDHFAKKPLASGM